MRFFVVVEMFKAFLGMLAQPRARAEIAWIIAQLTTADAIQ